ncbi:MAG: hypothetical protein Q4C88_05440 [Akkermansia sp.]|nr:hypothetical protein [Akkermansia sp.]
MNGPCHRLPRRAGVWAAALALLAAGGALLALPSARLATMETTLGLTRPLPRQERGDALAQRLSFLTLGGLRALTAELLTADATDAWLVQDWPRAQTRWRQITTLAPQRPNYWIRAARDMTRNAVAHAMGRRDLEPPAKAALAEAYLESGERFLLDGAANNPQNPLIYLELGNMYENTARRPQFAKAAEAYSRALELGAPPMYRRWVFYNLARIRGREREALDLGLRLFEDPAARTPSLRCLLFVLQNKLDIPRGQRLGVQQLFGDERRARRQLSSFLHNDLRFPTTGVAAFLEEGQTGGI